MERQEMLKWKKAAWQKLMGAIAMLLVASIMMSATSYAWFVLSTAPEITDLTTTAGANGALEIALQSNKADGNGRADILSGVGQSIAGKDAQTANTYWGNVVDLSKGYGLEHITLYPARLNLNGEVVNTTSMLSIPTFGTDGRVTSLKNAEKTYYKDGKFEQGQSHWGVNVMGATSDRAGVEETITLTYNRDFVLNEARTKVAEYRTSLREQMTKTIEDNDIGIIELMFYTRLGESELTPRGEDTVRNYVTAMEEIVATSTMALRWALMANAAADTKRFDSSKAEDMQALGELYAKCLKMDLTGQDSILSYAVDYGYSGIAEVAMALNDAATSVKNAQNNIAEGNYALAGLCLVTTEETYFQKTGGQTETLLSALDEMFTADEKSGKFAPNTLTQGSIYTVRKNSSSRNLLSIIATVLGDYSGEMRVWHTIYIDENTEEIVQSWYEQAPEKVETGHVLQTHLYSLNATGKANATDWADVSDLSKVQKDESGKFTANVGILGEVSDQINGITAPGTIQVQLTRSDLSAYGYSVDLALQCSKSTDLQLQQEAVTRVEGDTSGQTMGSGSTMAFVLPGDLTEAQVRKLIRGIYVVLMNTDTGVIYKIAAVDPDQLTIDQFQTPYRATGTLALYEPAIQDDVLSLGDKATSITRMNADTQLNLTALVFLNGDQVDASMFSGTQALSLTGTLNLQFASSEALTAMDYTFETNTENP